MLSVPDFKEKHVVLVFAKAGQKLSFKNDNLIVTSSEMEIVLQLTCYRIFSVWIIGSTNLSSGVLEHSKRFCFSIVMFSYGFRPYGIWNSLTEGNFLLREKQYKYQGIDLAKLVVYNKIGNQQRLLKSMRRKDTHCKDAIKKLDGYRVGALNSNSFDSLLGLEGSASRMYFQIWFGDTGWQGRKPRAKRDPVNTLMDIGYTLLFNFIDALLSLYGFDVYKGIYHQNFYQRKSLVCDIVEPFRVIIDHRIKNAYSLGQIKQDDFLQKYGKYQLDFKKSKTYSRWLLESILEHKEAMFLYVQQYYRCFLRNKELNEYPHYNFINQTIHCHENASNI